VVWVSGANVFPVAGLVCWWVPPVLGVDLVYSTSTWSHAW